MSARRVGRRLGYDWALTQLRRRLGLPEPLDPARFPGAVVFPSAILKGVDNISLAPGAEVQEQVIIDARFGPCSIGANSQVNPYTVVYAGGGVTIGADVLIAPHCMLVAANHDIGDPGQVIRLAGIASRGPIVIEDGAWVAAGCTVTDGVRIGAGAVVAANSVVTRDVAPLTVVAGSPARMIGDRRTWAAERGEGR